LRAALEHLHRIAKPGSNIYVISDFKGLDERCEQFLRQLAIHNNLTCIFVYDALEENLPLPGLYNITDGIHRSSIDTHTGSIRKLYQEEFTNQVERLSSVFSKMKVTLITLRTDQVVLEQLETWNHKTH
jgi:hypothetical protein